MKSRRLPFGSASGKLSFHELTVHVIARTNQRFWLTLLYGTLMISFLTFSYIAKLRLDGDTSTNMQVINPRTLTIVVIVSNEELSEAAKDTWMLGCPFPVTLTISSMPNISTLRIHRRRSQVLYTLTVDVSLYVFIARLQQLLLDNKLHRHCLSPEPISDCESVPDDILFGPLRTLREFDRIHSSITDSSRRPIQNRKGYDASIDHHCVHNPLIQRETYRNFRLPECPLKPFTATPIDLSELLTTVITLKNDDDEQIVNLRETFRYHGLTARVFQGFQGTVFEHAVQVNSSSIHKGERNLRETMRRLFTQMIASNANRVLIVEDDVFPHRHFGTRLKQLLTTDHPDRCSAHLFDESHAGGALLLGASVWPAEARGWPMIDEEMKNNSFSSTCFNLDLTTYGSFAHIVHRNAYQTILTWLNDPKYALSPYDHVFRYLSRRGHIVRTIFPFLVIPEVSHPSLVNPTRNATHRNAKLRRELHRWTPLSDYFVMNVTHRTES